LTAPGSWRLRSLVARESIAAFGGGTAGSESFAPAAGFARHWGAALAIMAPFAGSPGRDGFGW
jgi:hypothetical protein